MRTSSSLKGLQRQRLLEYYAQLAEGTVFVRPDDMVALAQARGMRPDARILDVGCGQGQVAIALARAFPHSQVIGIDLSPEQIERAQRAARATGTTNTQFLVSDWNAFKLPNDGVDLLLATQVLQFLPDELEFAEYVVQGLAPQGMCVIRTILLPDEEPGRSFVNSVFMQSIVGAVRFYSERDVTELLREVGFGRFRIDKEEIWLDSLPPEQAHALDHALQYDQLSVDDVQPWFWSGTVSAVRR